MPDLSFQGQSHPLDACKSITFSFWSNSITFSATTFSMKGIFKLGISKTHFFHLNFFPSSAIAFSILSSFFTHVDIALILYWIFVVSSLLKIVVTVYLTLVFIQDKSDWYLTLIVRNSKSLLLLFYQAISWHFQIKFFYYKHGCEMTN